MKMTQISVFLENKTGRLYDVCELLDDNGINMRAMIIAETEEYGVLRMIVDQPDSTLSLLRAGSFTANITQVTAVEVEDKPGALKAILKVLSDGKVNIEYMYGFTEKFADKAILVFRFEDSAHAKKVLTANNISVVTDENIKDL
jgi:hypothetical protein